MEHVEYILNGRKYRALSDGQGQMIIEGPPEGLVDSMELPEPLATRLHNSLYERGLIRYEDVVKRPREMQGALQEALQLDSQKLSEAYFRFSGGSQ